MILFIIIFVIVIILLAFTFLVARAENPNKNWDLPENPLYQKDLGYAIIYLSKDYEWNYTYRISEVFKKANSNRKKEARFYLFGRPIDAWDVGMVFSRKMEEELAKCKIEWLEETLTNC